MVKIIMIVIQHLYLAFVESCGRKTVASPAGYLMQKVTPSSAYSGVNFIVQKRVHTEFTLAQFKAVKFIIIYWTQRLIF